MGFDFGNENYYHSRMDEEMNHPTHAPLPLRRPIETAAPPQVTSADLLGATGELVIMHRGRQYRLRVTQNGKLILTA